MRGRVMRRGVAIAAALMLGAAAGAVPAGADPDPAEVTPLSTPGMPVSLAQAGELAVWSGEARQSAVPASLSGFAVSQVVLPSDAGLALTADGRVVGWGANGDRLQQVPAGVTSTKVAQIAATKLHAGAVTRDGRVLMWGRKLAAPDPTDVPAGMTNVKQLAITSTAGIALKGDGSVVAWGTNLHGITNVPAGLKATAIAASDASAYALTEQGSVVHWGDGIGSQGVPELPEGQVKAISASLAGGLALTENNKLVGFGHAGFSGHPAPAEANEGESVLLANGGDTVEFASVDRDRTIHHWFASSGSGLPDEVPSDLNGRAITQIVLGLLSGASTTGAVVIAKMLRAELPQVTGTARVGSVLTGVPGTFSASPDSVTNEWLVNGVPVSGSGATLAVTAAMVGKTISYRSTAVKAGETTVSSSSAGVRIPPVVVPPVPSTTKVAKVAVAKKAAKVTVTAKVSATRSTTGKAVVTIKKGSKTIVSKPVGVSAAGSVKLAVAKFAKLVVKKTKAKGKRAKTAHRGKYAVTVKYLGNSQVKPSTGTGKFSVKK
jgi:hypothetical protein